MTHVKACIQQTLLYNALGNQQPEEENHANSKAKMLCLSGLLILSLCACQNTVKGVGEDVEATGKVIAGKK